MPEVDGGGDTLNGTNERSRSSIRLITSYSALVSSAALVAAKNWPSVICDTHCSGDGLSGSNSSEKPIVNTFTGSPMSGSLNFHAAWSGSQALSPQLSSPSVISTTYQSRHAASGSLAHSPVVMESWYQS